MPPKRPLITPIFISLFLALSLGLFVLSGSSALAQGIIPAASGPTDSTSCPSGDASYCGNYTPNDFVSLAINISKWILGLVGSLSLIMFIYGGLMFLISSGASEKIATAKKILISAVIGLIIVFSSYLIIQFVLGSLGINWSGKIAVMTTK